MKLTDKETETLRKLLVHGVDATFETEEFGDEFPTIEFAFRKHEKPLMLKFFRFLKDLENRALFEEGRKRDKNS